MAFGATAAEEGVDARRQPMGAAEVMTRAKAAISAAGTVRAELLMTCRYPATYTSEISILASPTGDERAEMKTTINQNSFHTLEIISGGVLWSEQETPGGIIVGKIDLARVKSELRARDEEFAALPVLGTNLVFDIANMAKLVEFDTSEATETSGRDAWVLTGSLQRRFAEGEGALPAGAVEFYKTVRLHIDAESFLPLLAELGWDKGEPLLSVEFKEIEGNVEPGEDAFAYEPPEDAHVVDRTDWAIGQLTGE